MKTYKLEPLSKFALSTQIDRLHPDDFRLNFMDFIREADKMTNPINGDVYLFASQEEETAYKEEAKRLKEIEDEAKKHKYDHIKTPFIDFNNSERWRNGLNEAQKKGFPVVEMCEDAYYHFLECVPPKIMQGSFYMCSEPHHHNSKGQEICIAGLRVKDKYYAQYGTRQDYKERKMFKTFPN